MAGLHERLRPEPCQTPIFAAAPDQKPDLEPPAASIREAEPRFRGSERLRPPSSRMPLARGRGPSGRRRWRDRARRGWSGQQRWRERAPEAAGGVEKGSGGGSATKVGPSGGGGGGGGSARPRRRPRRPVARGPGLHTTRAAQRKLCVPARIIGSSKIKTGEEQVRFRG